MNVESIPQNLAFASTIEIIPNLFNVEIMNLVVRILMFTGQAPIIYILMVDVKI